MRRWLSILFVLFMLLVPVRASAAQLSCDSFASQEQAQAVFNVTQSDILDEDGDGIACESLGNDTTAATAPEPTAIGALPGSTSSELTDQEEEYIDALSVQVDTAGEASLALADLFAEAGVDITLLFDDVWVFEVATQFVLLQQLGVDAESLEPSSRQESIHEIWLDINRLITLAVDDMVFGIDNIEPASIDLGGARFVYASLLTEDLTSVLLAFAADPNAPFEGSYPLGGVDTCDEFADFDVAQQYYAAHPEAQAVIDPDFDGFACEVFFERGSKLGVSS